ncbi:hypothetical protein [Streptomyces sp. NPDC051909]|uniref:hypothetical protein n=1 Tax=Streptomyces sp. NPDC051909 TaxID=3154944 RepID=UPI0034428F93
MAHTRRRLLRAAGVWAAGAVLLLAGCSGGTDTGAAPPGKASASPEPGSKPEATATPAPTTTAPRPAALDPRRAPRTTAAAEHLARAVVAGPDAWGPDYEKRSPHLSPDGYWPVLGADCVWDTGSLPRSVLASATAYSEIPAAGGKGTLRVAATITIHRTESDADWELAGTLEEALRCPDQELRQGERVNGLSSLGTPYGDSGNTTTADSVLERGSYLGDASGKPQFYTWFQTRVGQVTFATVVKGAPGYTEAETNTAQVRANVIMQDRLKKQWGAQS